MILKKLIILVLTAFGKCIADEKRIYDSNQFPVGSEQLVLPKVLHYSIYMGKLHYTYFPLTLESMRYNANVTFVLLNVIEDGSNQAEDTKRIVDKCRVKNFVYKVVTIVSYFLKIYSQFSNFTKFLFFSLN
jgi:hypothetical protein